MRKAILIYLIWIMLGLFFEHNFLVFGQDCSNWDEMSVYQRRLCVEKYRPDLPIFEEALKNAESWRDYYLTYEERKQKAERTKWNQAVSKQPKNIQELIRKKEIQLGMTSEQVRLSWGKPDDVNRTVGRWGVHKQ